ncbi:hypothetical protein EZV62_018275 [Acer yangbiense]|uniref:Reverse transcriptase Ty1/copia-type domain-containing protein n=1 Tax=Acer yangbiense TaxID=1000413 RepID=A0A5C7HKV7_9ROSI|nr:hypothetical protein EZV62_018275 [Acer yangbiense]
MESKLTLENSGGDCEHGRGPSQRGGTSYRGRGRGRGNYSQTGYGSNYSQTGYGSNYSQTGYGRGMVHGLPNIELSDRVCEGCVIEKSAALAVFKQFKARVEIESNYKLCTLRSDRGGEYTSNAFQVFCRDNGNSERLFMEFKQTMFDEFEMTDNGLMSFFLGIEIRQDQNGIFVCQQKFTEELLEKFKMNDCNIVTTPVAADLHLTKEGDDMENGAQLLGHR